MKKIFLFFLLIAAFFTKTAVAQNNENAGAMLQNMKERLKPAMIAKASITDAQADKVVEIIFALQRQRRDVKKNAALSEDEKKSMYKQIDEARDKEFSGIPLTAEQIKAVNLVFEEEKKQQKKSAPKKD
jgi:hypothetical protein